MRYFELRQGEGISRPMSMVWLKKKPFCYNPSREEFARFPSMLVGYYEYKEETQMPDVFESDTYFVSDEVKHVLAMYDDTIEFKGVQIYPSSMDIKVTPSYWSFYPTEAACLHHSAEVLPNGTIREVILDRSKIPQADIFKISGIKVHRIIVTLPVAESLLRRSIYGIQLNEVKVM